MWILMELARKCNSVPGYVGPEPELEILGSKAERPCEAMCLSGGVNYDKVQNGRRFNRRLG
jgi:hypothetical protein